MRAWDLRLLSKFVYFTIKYLGPGSLSSIPLLSQCCCFWFVTSCASVDNLVFTHILSRPSKFQTAGTERSQPAEVGLFKHTDSVKASGLWNSNSRATLGMGAESSYRYIPAYRGKTNRKRYGNTISFMLILYLQLRFQYCIEWVFIGIKWVIGGSRWARLTLNINFLDPTIAR